MYRIHFYINERGDVQARSFIKDLNIKSRAKIGQYINLLEQHGQDLLRPCADQVRDKIRELRIRTNDGNIRIFYFFFIEKNIILLHAFKKKTQEVPQREIEQAQRNMHHFLEQFRQGRISL